MRQYAIGNYYSTLSTWDEWLMRDRPPWASSLAHWNHSYISLGFRYDARQVFMAPIPDVTHTQRFGVSGNPKRVI